MHTRSGLAALAVVVALGGCRVETTPDDVLRELYACDADADCVDGWACRGFGLDPSATRYCARLCDAHDDCRPEERCGNEGFCVETCELAEPACRDDRLSCMRRNLTAGETSGYCQPAAVCDDSQQCPQVVSQCVSDIVSAAYPQYTLELGSNACVATCPPGTLCPSGFVCAPTVAQEFDVFLEMPPICVPNCGQDDGCPEGMRCLVDALRLLFPDETFTDLHRICAPGLPTILAPCRGDEDCLVGHCVLHPAQTLDGGDPLYVCAMPCEPGGSCADVEAECLPSHRLGESVSYCFR